MAVVAILISSAAASADTASPFVRFSTSLGNIDVELLPQYAPQTVANFLSYVNSNAYATTFFHRSVPGFIIQGGGFRLANGSIQGIAARSPVPNEYSLPNVRGTIAMALVSRQAGSPPDPNSATNEWFFNLADNTGSLDPQKFAVFGQVLDPASLSVMDAIAGQQVIDHGAPLDQLPVTGYTAGQPLTAANLIMSPITVLNDSAPPTISITVPANAQQFTVGATATPQFSCDDGSGTGVAVCAASGPIDTTSAGQRTFTVTATDYGGNTASQSVSYEVVAAAEPPAAPVTPVTPVAPVAPSVPAGPAVMPASGLPTIAGSITSSARGVASLPLNCPGAKSCSGTATLYAFTGSGRHRLRTPLGTLRYSLAAGRRRAVGAHLTRGGLALLRDRRRLQISVVLAPSGGTGRTVNARLTLAR